MYCSKALAEELMQLGLMELVWPLAWQAAGLMVLLRLGTKIWTGLPSLYVALEKSPLRSAMVGTVEKASYGELPRLPFHPAKKNVLFPPLKILGMFKGPPRNAPKRGRL